MPFFVFSAVVPAWEAWQEGKRLGLYAARPSIRTLPDVYYPANSQNLLPGRALTRIFNNCVDKTGKNSYGEKQAEPALPRHLFAIRHILQHGDDKPGDAGDIGGRLQDLPEGRLHGHHQITTRPQIEEQIACRGQTKRYFFPYLLHMNTLETLYFPDTVLPAHRQFPLALFFSRVHLLQPVEDDETGARDSVSATESYPFMEKDFCQVHTPAPLGADRDRFLHLVNDIKNRKDNYVEQLSYLSLASLSDPAQRDDQSGQTIISSLLQGVDRDSQARDESLWQARLVLSIAETLDCEEEELVRQLAAIDDQEIALFRSLQGEIIESGEEDAGDDPFQELLELRQKLNQPRPGMIKKRLRAWSRLYLAGPPAEELPLWTTHRPEAADILLEQYEKECGHAPVVLLQIHLPARSGGDNRDTAEKMKRFREAIQPQMEALVNALNKLVQEERAVVDPGAPLLLQMETWRETWNTMLEQWCPENQNGRLPFTIYLLPDMPLSELIGKLLGKTSPAARHGLLAVCG